MAPCALPTPDRTIFNGFLLAIPVSIVLFIYASLKIDIAMQPSSINGDAGTYQHEFVGVSDPVWPIVAFFVVPSVILLTKLTLSFVGRRPSVDGYPLAGQLTFPNWAV